MWLGCQSRRFSCLFWRETRQRILGHEISPYPEVGRGRERGSWRGTRTRSWRRDPAEGSWRLDSREAVGGWTAKRRTAESWRGTTEGQSTPDSRDSRRQDRVQWRRVSRCLHSSSIVEFSLVTHASDSLHMHVVLHNFLCSWLTPSFVCSFVLLFSPFPRSYSCVGKEMCVTPSATSWSPAG